VDFIDKREVSKGQIVPLSVFDFAMRWQSVLICLLSLFTLFTGGNSLAFWNQMRPSSSLPKLKTVAVTGSTGLVGKALCQRLSEQGVTVRRFTTGQLPPAASVGTKEEWYKWDSTRGVIDPNAFANCDCVIHLAGENIASGSFESPLAVLGSWTENKKAKILNSRVDGTRLVVETINKMAINSRPKVLVTASAVGYYGYTNNERIFNEEFGQGDGFLAQVVRSWEAEAVKCKTRTAFARFGVVLSKDGGVVSKLLPLFRLAAGGCLGSGKQGFSWVTLDDAVSALVFAAENSELKGPFNVCSPQPCTNEKFTQALAKAVKRPAIVPLPEFAARFLFGEFGEEVLLGGQKAVPTKLTSANFKFKNEDIEQALESIL